jgi:hypothetical protein
MGHRNVIPTPMNPVELAGGYGHIQHTPALLQPGHNDRDTRVEIEKVTIPEFAGKEVASGIRVDQ